MRYLFIVLLISLGGCDFLSSEEAPASTEDAINFSNLQVGQVSQYIGFKGENYYTRGESTFGYQSPRLRVEVVATTDSGFVFSELVTNHDSDACCFIDSTFYHVKIVDQMLSVSKMNADYLQSNLFVLARHPLPLQEILENEIQLDGIQAISAASDGFQTGFISNHTQFDRQYERLNAMFDWTPTYVDGPGHFTAYSEAAGIVRAFTLNPWTGSVVGWDLME